MNDPMGNNDGDKNQFVDIGANLLDERFQGIYRGTVRHDPDLDLVIERAVQVGIRHIVVTAGTLEDSRKAIEFCRAQNAKQQQQQQTPGIRFSCTVGVHPTRCQQEFIDKVGSHNDSNENNPHYHGVDDEDVLRQLLDLAMSGQSDGTVVAIGEFGLDYDRLEFCSKPVQQKYFIRQLQVLAKHTNLPLFLHNRQVGCDLWDILTQYRDCWGKSGVVHSFDDSLVLAQQFLDLGLYIGLNGCSLKTENNLATIHQLPLERILLETDCPYCDIRNTHAGFSHLTATTTTTATDPDFEFFKTARPEKKFVWGQMVKNRQEPSHIILVARIVASLHGKALNQVANIIYQNSLNLFGWVDDTDHPKQSLS